MKMQKPRYWSFAFTTLNLKIINKSLKTKQYSKQTCLQIIVLLNITTNTCIKMVDKNIPTTLQYIFEIIE